MEIMAGVRVACRADSRIQPLGHVVQMIDEFADVSPFWTLLGAVKLGSARLVHRVLCHTCESLRDQNNLQQFEHATRPAAVMGNLQVMQLLHEVGVVALNNTTAVAAALSGDLSFLKWVQATALELFHRARSWAEQVAFDVAAERGSLNTVQWLVEAFPGTVWSLGPAALGGNLETVKWLHEHANLGEVQQDFPFGTLNRISFELCMQYFEECSGEETELKALAANRNDGCSPEAVNGTAEAGNLQILLWLNTHYSAQWTSQAMDRAAQGGHLGIVQWMHHTRNEGCSTAGCTQDAADHAAGSGHLDVVQFLYANRTEGGTAIAAVLTEERGMFEVLRWFAEQNIGLVIPGEEDEDL
ncbi:hypothetical protein F444_18072 [Phytophthora nicotianae P1976]|uniref:Uncharacterized protein n=1 Tax=Phytophthora nicotianae P1976 TaxID=1317066 RepID=A0A080ZCP2_PHYNI|nr:hypothetical protein F444_18072 [Phytophthora nicotianae P1976]